MKTSVWIRMKWYDHNLKWKPADFGNTEYVVIPVEELWIPDIGLVNTAITTVNEKTAQALIKYTGRVFWAPQRTYSSACLIDVTEFPYDRHSCEMWFQSLANSYSKVNVTLYDKSPMDMETYLTSYKHAQEWNILANTSHRHVRPRDVGMVLMWSRRPALQFTLTVQRRPGFKGILLIVPCTLLSFLIPLIFCLPPERPDRHTVAMSLYGSLTILLFMVIEAAPPSTSFVPRLALYYCFNLLVLLVATCCSAVVVNLHKRGEARARVPRVVRSIFIEQLGKLLCFNKRLKHLYDVEIVVARNRSNRSRTLNESQSQKEWKNDKGPVRPSVSLHSYLAQPYTRDKSGRTMSVDDHPLVQSEGQGSGYPAEQKCLQSEVNSLDVGIPLDIRVEWQTLAMVLDRLFSYTFFFIDFISLAIFYPKTA